MKNANIEIAESYVLSLKNKDLSRIPLAEDALLDRFAIGWMGNCGASCLLALAF